MTIRLRVGMGDSYGLRPTVFKNPDFDPSAVTGVKFMVTKPAVNGVVEHVEWIGTLDTQSSTSVRAVYAFNADGSDLNVAGTWRFWLQWTQPGASPGPRTEVGSFIVVAADAT